MINEKSLIEQLMLSEISRLNKCAIAVLKLIPECQLYYYNEELCSLLSCKDKQRLFNYIINGTQINKYKIARAAIEEKYRDAKSEKKDFDYIYNNIDKQLDEKILHIHGTFKCINDKCLFLIIYIYNITETQNQQNWINSVLYKIPKHWIGIQKLGDDIYLEFANIDLIKNINICSLKSQKEVFEGLLKRIHIDDLDKANKALGDLFSDSHRAEVILRFKLQDKKEQYSTIIVTGKSYEQKNNSYKAVLDIHIVTSPKYEFNNKSKLCNLKNRETNNLYEVFSYIKKIEDNGKPLNNRYGWNQNTKTSVLNMDIMSEKLLIQMNNDIIADCNIKYLAETDDFIINFKDAGNLYGVKEYEYSDFLNNLKLYKILKADDIDFIKSVIDRINITGKGSGIEVIINNTDGSAKAYYLYIEKEEDNNYLTAHFFANNQITKKIENYWTKLHKIRQYSSIDLVFKAGINVSEDKIKYFYHANDILSFKDNKYTDFIHYLYERILDDMEKENLIVNFLPQYLQVKYRDGVRDYYNDYKIIMLNGQECWIRIHVYLLANPYNDQITAFLYVFNTQTKMIAKEINKYIIGNNYSFVGYINVISEHIKGTSYTDYNECILDDDVTYKAFVENYLVENVNEIEREYIKGKIKLSTVRYKLNNKKTYVFENTEIQNGKIVHKVWNFRYLTERNNNILISIQDDTDYYLEKEEKNEKLEKALTDAKIANMAKNDFLSHMSHDLKTPLNTVINLSKVLTLEYDKDTKLNSSLKQIESAGRMLENIIDNVLDEKYILQHQLVLNLQKYSYQEFLSYITATMNDMCSKKNISFHTDGLVLTKYIYVDIVRFNQLFMNILTNAVKYTKEGGFISFTVGNVRFEGRNIYCEYHIRDDGEGMDDEFVSSAFKPFAKEIFTGEAYEGTGLGLPIAKNIAQAMNGDISIISEKGIGTDVTISIKLPLALKHKPKEDISETNSLVCEQLKGKTVLVVEDYAPNRLLVIRFLGMLGIICEWAENGLAAITKYTEGNQQFDAILMDIRMPVMDGLTAAKKIRSCNVKNYDTIPIIAMTANLYTEKEEDQVSRKAVFNRILEKPLDIDMLRQVLLDFIK